MLFAYNLLQNTKNIPITSVLNKIKKSLKIIRQQPIVILSMNLLNPIHNTYTLLIFNYIDLYVNPPSALLHIV
jgi:hypothetical protein